MDDRDLITCAIWALEHAEPEWANVASLERELRQAGWTHTQSRRAIAAAKQLECDLRVRELLT